MPFINVKTNVSVTEDRAESVKSLLGQAITAIPGKSEAWLMVEIEAERKLWFKGTGEEAAMVEVSLFGGASHNAYLTLTSHITGIISSQFGIPTSRIYVKYSETSNWGWNGSNF
jgi:phenylpyruvate tautomerase PptA (4-oxalocrotonate tautomerase family)